MHLQRKLILLFIVLLFPCPVVLLVIEHRSCFVGFWKCLFSHTWLCFYLSHKNNVFVSKSLVMSLLHLTWRKALQSNLCCQFLPSKEDYPLQSQLDECQHTLLWQAVYPFLFHGYNPSQVHLVQFVAVTEFTGLEPADLSALVVSRSHCFFQNHLYPFGSPSCLP